MKKTLVLSLCVVATSLSVYAQGQFQALNLNNRVVDAGGVQVGTGHTGQWWAGADAGSLAAVGPATPILAAGLVSAGIVDVAGVAGGSTASVQLSAWADAAPGLVGMSGVGSVGLVTAGGIEIPARPDFGNSDNIVIPVPEPSAIALAVLGGAALFFARRRK